MSNIQFSVTINPGVLQDTSSGAVDPTGEAIFNILLNPFYAMEQDILVVFIDEHASYLETVRAIIFDSSIYIDDILTLTIQKSLGLTDEQAFRVKRHYVICKSVFMFGKIFFRDYLKSVKKSKFLADIKVSLEIEKEPALIQQLSKDAKDCVDEIENMLGASTGFQTFVKGEWNPCNKESHRQWYPGMGNGYPRVSIGASKAETFCRKYKIGADNGII